MIAILNYLVTIVTVVGIVVLVCYVFQAAGLFGIAKKRGVAGAWMAWIPVLSDRLLGCIGDAAEKQKRLKTAVLLPVLSAAALALAVSVTVWADNTLMTTPINELGDMMNLLIFTIVVGVVYLVVRYITLYRVYAVHSNRAVLLLVFSVIFPVIVPFALFGLSRKRA